jgi:5-methylcytosine-specific restriction endonuclease McrA
MDEDKITTYKQALENERLWDESNVRNLCRKCHRKY